MRLLSAVLGLLTGCEAIRASIIDVYPTEYVAPELGTAEAGTGPVAVFDGPDARLQRLNVRLRLVADGLSSPTDIQFPPDDPTRMLVLEKDGRAFLLTRGDDGTFGQRRSLVDISVLTSSEQGLLGAAFHPKFAENGKIYFNHVVDHPAGDTTRIAEWIVADPAAAQWEIREQQTILELRQPYANHNAGQLAFGPDGMLYIGFGDGGWRDDPHGHGQNTATWLGAMLRIDIDHQDPGKHYAVPADNPFRDNSAYQPEIWATGLRNPWRCSFDPLGRLIVADVGQNAWEEVSIVPSGGNMGWSGREGRHCFAEACPEPGPQTVIDPVYEYSHRSGQSITGGYVATSPEDSAISGKYIFADFVSGRMWALDLPAETSAAPPLAEAYALGNWGMLFSTFGRDPSGRLFVADYGKGRIYRIEG